MSPAVGSVQTVVVVAFLVFVTVCVLLCALAGPDRDDAADFYTANRSLGTFRNALAISGDYISAATVLSTTGVIALAGFDGMMVTCATALALLLVMVLLAEPLRNAGRFTLGDVLAARMATRQVRIAAGVVALAVTMPFLVVQLSGAGSVVAVLLGLSGYGARTVCVVLIGATMVCYAAIGGMKGTGLVQIVKMVIAFASFGALALLVLHRFEWNLGTLLTAASQGSGLGDSYLRPGAQYGSGATGRLEFLSVQITLVLGAACLPHITMRLHSAPDARTARTSMRWAVGITAAFLATVVVAGLGASALVGGAVIRDADPTGRISVLLLSHTLGGAPGTTGSSAVIAVVSCAVFVTILASVAGVTLAAACSLAHDLYAHAARGGGLPEQREVAAARWAAVGVGVVGIVLAVLTERWNVQMLLSLTYSLSASALFPILVYSLFWRGFTQRGLLWTLYGSLASVCLLMLFSPAVSGGPGAVFPGVDFHWFPLRTPGVVTVPLGFLLGWFGSVQRPAPESDVAGFERLELRALTGVTDSGPRHGQ
ncbi:Na+(H+)/acetate symporter ActP [Streptacidiphilus sp. MAP12-16]|uniref:sodium/solute symporter n=1 Tax=Streptacidiphilus sp. MAP12-16 TaxID=3156300 RepID=UPI003513C146